MTRPAPGASSTPRTSAWRATTAHPIGRERSRSMSSAGPEAGSPCVGAAASREKRCFAWKAAVRESRETLRSAGRRASFRAPAGQGLMCSVRWGDTWRAKAKTEGRWMIRRAGFLMALIVASFLLFVGEANAGTATLGQDFEAGNVICGSQTDLQTSV